MADSRAYVTWSRSNTSSVKPCNAPSGSSTSRTGRSRLESHDAAAIRWLMCSRLRWISARLRTPRTVGIRPTAVYGSGTAVLDRRQHDVVFDGAPLTLFDACGPLGIVRGAWHERADQRAFDREHGVRVQVLAGRVKDVGLQALEAWRGDNHVDVRRPPRVALRGFEHRANRAIVRNGVGDRPHAHKGIRSIRAGKETPAQVVLVALGLLDRVQAIGVVLPHVQLGAGDRPALQIADVAVYERGDAERSLDHALGEVALRCVRRPERTEHGRLHRLWRERIGPRVNQAREAQSARPQDELAALLVGDVAGGLEDVDGCRPFVLRQPHIGREGMQVADEALQDLLAPRIWTAIERCNSCACKFLCACGRSRGRHPCTPSRSLPRVSSLSLWERAG